MNKKIFITGTNTEVGKTFITKNLIERVQLKGYSVSPYKPVETGCIKKSLTLIPRDSMIYFRAINKKIALDQINPYRFLEPISPAAAIKRSVCLHKNAGICKISTCLAISEHCSAL